MAESQLPPGARPFDLLARGDEIFASFLNEITGRIQRLEQLQMNPVAAVFAALPPDQLIQCRMIGRRFNGTLLPAGVMNPAVPSEITYDYVGIGQPSITRTNAPPVYGREVRNDECLIYPAPEGVVCYLVMSPRAGTESGRLGELMLLPGCEVPARRRCGTGANGLQALTPGLLKRLTEPKKDFPRRRPEQPRETPPQFLSQAAPVADSGGALSTETGDPSSGGGDPTG